MDTERRDTVSPTYAAHVPACPHSSGLPRLLALTAVLLGSMLDTSAVARERVPALAVQRAGQAAETEEQARALRRASDAVVGVEVTAVDEAGSIDTLGRERSGSGVVIGDDGVVLTIGYLLLEADEVSLRLDTGRRVPAQVLHMDLASGFGLLRALLPIGVAPAPLAARTDVARDEALMLVSGGSGGAVSMARLAARRAYSGFWEYHLEAALFTHPPRTDHSGAGLFNARGELLGVGSLLVMDTPGEHEAGPGNMFVPVDLLAPLLADLRERRSAPASARAWLGLNCAEGSEGVHVTKVSRGSPAEAAGIEAGDVITRIDGVSASGLEAFYKRLWHGGQAERDIALQVLREGRLRDVAVRSVDRLQTLRRARSI